MPSNLRGSWKLATIAAGNFVEMKFCKIIIFALLSIASINYRRFPCVTHVCAARATYPQFRMPHVRLNAGGVIWHAGGCEWCHIWLIILFSVIRVLTNWRRQVFKSIPVSPIREFEKFSIFFDIRRNVELLEVWTDFSRVQCDDEKKWILRWMRGHSMLT